jgi:hypothetical protein
MGAVLPLLCWLSGTEIADYILADDQVTTQES